MDIYAVVITYEFGETEVFAVQAVSPEEASEKALGYFNRHRTYTGGLDVAAVEQIVFDKECSDVISLW